MESKKGITWTDREIEYLKELFNLGLSDEEIAEKLQRTLDGIKAKRHLFGLNRTASYYNGTWTDEEKQMLKDNYAVMTVDELAKLLNKTSGSIRGMKTKLGLHKRNHPRSDAELDIIKEYYENHINQYINLSELSEMLGRTPQIISRWAREMGYTENNRPNSDFAKRTRQLTEREIQIQNAVKEALEKVDKSSDTFNSEFQKALWQTDYYKNVVRPEFSKKISELWKVKGHPRGFLGKHHTQEVCDLVSRITRERYANMTQEEKHAIAMKGIQTKKEKGTYMNTTSNAYSRTKSGKRQDLNGQYFRSAWEANIARVLNHLQINWQYELKRFYFENSVEGVLSYQPDFYLPEFDMWVEVKGWMDEKSKTRLKLFKEQYPEEYNKLMLIDQKKYYELERDYKFLPNWEGNGVYHNKSKTLEE